MQTKVRSLESLSLRLAENPALQDEFKKDPVTALQEVRADNPLTTDKWIYRIIVGALGATVLSIVIGVLVLMAKTGADAPIKDGNIPTILTAIGSAAIGAIAGLLAPPPKNQAE